MCTIGVSRPGFVVYCVQRSLLGNGKVTVKHRETAINYTGQLCRKNKATENFGKLSGNRNIQGDSYIQGCYRQV